MALNTRRMSGMAAQPGAHALLDTFDAFRRKHVTQNKEIIHRNSDLMRANTDLANKLREAQNELVALRGDYAQLGAASAHLEARNEALKAQLSAAHDEIRRRDHQNGEDAGGAGGLDGGRGIRMQDERFQALRITLDKVVAQLQGAQAICLLTSSDHQNSLKAYSPVSPPESPSYAAMPMSYSSSSRSNLPNVPPPAQHRLERRASTTALVSAQPDLSFISEGSQEPSLSLSQQGYKPYSSSDDEDEDENENEEGEEEGTYVAQYTAAADLHQLHGVNHIDSISVTQHMYETQQQQMLPFNDQSRDMLTASYASTVEADGVSQEIEANLLSTSPKRPPPTMPFSLSTSSTHEPSLARSTSLSPSPTPTMPSFPIMPGSFLADSTGSDNNDVPGSSDVVDVSKKAKTVASSRLSAQSESRRPRPSLVDALGVSPGHLDISFGQGSIAKAESAKGRRPSRLREISPTPNTENIEGSDDDAADDGPYVASRATTQKAPDAHDPDGLALSKTVRHSNSATSLREKAKAAAAAESSPANRVIARRRSNPTLSLSAGTEKSSNSSLGGSLQVRDRKSMSASVLDTKPKSSSKLVQSMQSRPSNVALTSLDGKAGPGSGASTASAKPTTVAIARPRSGSAVHRRLPSISPSNAKVASSPTCGSAESPVAATTVRCEDSPAPRLQAPSRAHVQSGNSKAEDTSNKAAEGGATSALAERTAKAVTQPTTSRIASTDKAGKSSSLKAVSPTTQTVVDREKESNRRARRSRSPFSPFESQESAEGSQIDMSAETGSSAAAREGRRARATVSYQEPSLNKKMRQPAGYVASIKTASSKHGVHGLGIRRKSSLKLGGQQAHGRSSVAPGDENDEEEIGENGLQDGRFSDGQSGDEVEL